MKSSMKSLKSGTQSYEYFTIEFHLPHIFNPWENSLHKKSLVSAFISKAAKAHENIMEKQLMSRKSISMKILKLFKMVAKLTKFAA